MFLMTYMESPSDMPFSSAWQGKAPTMPGSIPSIGGRFGSKQGHPLPGDVADTDVMRLLDVVDNERDAAMFGLMVGAGLSAGVMLKFGVRFMLVSVRERMS